MAPRGGTAVALYIRTQPGARREWVVNARPRPLYPGKETRLPFYRSWVGFWADLDGYGKSRPTGFRTPDRPARSESLYWLCYPGSKHLLVPAPKASSLNLLVLLLSPVLYIYISTIFSLAICLNPFRLYVVPISSCASSPFTLKT